MAGTFKFSDFLFVSNNRDFLFSFKKKKKKKIESHFFLRMNKKIAQTLSHLPAAKSSASHVDACFHALSISGTSGVVANGFPYIRKCGPLG